MRFEASKFHRIFIKFAHNLDFALGWIWSCLETYVADRGGDEPLCRTSNRYGGSKNKFWSPVPKTRMERDLKEQLKEKEEVLEEKEMQVQILMTQVGRPWNDVLKLAMDCTKHDGAHHD